MGYFARVQGLHQASAVIRHLAENHPAPWVQPGGARSWRCRRVDDRRVYPEIGDQGSAQERRCRESAGPGSEPSLRPGGLGELVDAVGLDAGLLPEMSGHIWTGQREMRRLPLHRVLVAGPDDNPRPGVRIEDALLDVPGHALLTKGVLG